MEMMGKIRRIYFRDKLSLHQIVKRTGLSRNTIRKWIRAHEDKRPVYQRQAAFNKLIPFHEMLEQALRADSLRAKHNRRNAKALFEQVKAEGYPALMPDWSRSYAAWEFTKTAQNVVFIVRPGTGQTHLASALAVSGITVHNKRVRFFST